ncbi:hypothetical protein NQ317_012679 [Molorchus minor]|uniref:Uncharacterized protein n=1 Tax=Molorchus minor TaxID=1323400 RepID=A0ABQ9JB85_9CUCU|nr:hypothetical protein NQ317_012679 [Molorchus minor]
MKRRISRTAKIARIAIKNDVTKIASAAETKLKQDSNADRDVDLKGDQTNSPTIPDRTYTINTYKKRERLWKLLCTNRSRSKEET